MLASDATHYYENIETGRPFPIVFDVGAMVEGWETLRALASSPDAIVPGHDPLVLQRYPAASPETARAWPSGSTRAAAEPGSTQRKVSGVVRSAGALPLSPIWS